MKKLILSILLLAIMGGCAYAQTIPNASPLYNSYSCNGSTTQFPYAFYINATSDMVVQQTDNLGNITLPLNFSVDTTNVWVNYPLTGSPCPSGYTITLYASTPITQTTSYGIRTPFTATVVGSSLNKLTIIGQQLQRQLNQSLLLPVGQTAGTFPSSSPGALIGWNGSGVLANIANPSTVGQWTLSGLNLYYSLGNVGILNSSPGVALDVTGTVRSTAQIVNGLETNTGNLTVAGNVGINSLTPGAALDVQGTVRAVGISLGGTTNTSWPTPTQWTGANPIYFNGNVGINSVTAGQTLDVQGTIRAVSFTGQNGSGLLGSWSTFTCETSAHGNTFQAATDLFITGTSTTNQNAICITDSNSSPTTNRNQNSGSSGGVVSCGTMVRKGDYYEVITAGSAGTCYKIPLGS